MSSAARHYGRICKVVERLEAAAEGRALTPGERRQLKIAKANKELVERQRLAKYTKKRVRGSSGVARKTQYGGVRAVVSGGLPGLGKKAK